MNLKIDKEQERGIARHYLSQSVIKSDLENMLAEITEEGFIKDKIQLTESEKDEICDELAESILDGSLMDDTDYCIAVNQFMFKRHQIPEYIPW